MNTTNNVYRFPFWGKTDKKVGGEHSHLLQHLLAVGANCHAILLQPAIARVTAETGRCDTGRLLPLLIWVAMLHDIGKLMRQFQSKCPWVFTGIGLPTPIQNFESFAHGDQGFLSLVDRDEKSVGPKLMEFYDWSDGQYGLVLSLWRGACSHHGHHVRQHEESRREPKLVATAVDVAKYLHDLVEHTVGTIFVPEIKYEKALTQNFSGYVAIADWLGSDTASHPFISIPDFEQNYLDLDAAAALYSRYLNQAQERLEDLKFSASANLDHLEQAVFPGVDTATVHLHPMQQAVLDAAKYHGAGLYIIEDAMGSGKTEAALLASHTLLQLGLGQGIVFALPSQGSADQTFTRVSSFSKTLFGIEPNLAHANAKFARERLRPSGQEQSGDQSSEHLSEWITSNNKRSFLAPVCAATVDQIMLAAMDCRHGFVRAASISRHVVIIDEVHAYDSYMGTVLNEVLKMLGASRTPVILLSATLPNRTRKEYLEAYRKGVAPGTVYQDYQAPHAYPLLTVCPAQSSPFSTPIAAATKARQVAVSLRGEDEIYQRLLSCAAEGCAAIICNSVKSALKRYKHLQDITAGTGIEVILLHARFRMLDRANRAKSILDVSNKRSTPEQRRQRIVVATQVIEQSLDLDFDYLASEIAPIDLLLQRIGRLFRHAREFRPAGFETPQFDVLDARNEGAPWDRATEMIYNQPSIMEATHDWLKAHDAINLPSEIADVVNSVYEQQVTTEQEHARRMKASGVAIDFLTVCGEDIVEGIAQSSDTRGSDGSTKFLLVRLDEDGNMLDLLDGTSINVLDSARPDVISLGFLEWADQRLINLRTAEGKGRPQEGDHMMAQALRGKWDEIVLGHNKYHRFFIVECSDPRPGKLDVVRVSRDYEYGELFGFRKIG